MNSRPELKLDWCSHEAAKYAVEKWHYSCLMPKGKLVKIGVWELGKFVGCVVFGDGANNNLFKPFNLKYEEGCELVRVALTRHKSPTSKIVSIAIKILSKAFSRLKIILSFADPEQGHKGTLYQAGNWYYLGETGSFEEFIVNGKRYHKRALNCVRSNHRAEVKAKNVLDWARKILDPNAYQIAGSSKYRYAYPLDNEIRERLKAESLPYPKCASGVDSDTSEFHSEEGGASPTDALQIIGG